MHDKDLSCDLLIRRFIFRNGDLFLLFFIPIKKAYGLLKAFLKAFKKALK
jgi:hypothetical protein